MQKGANGGNDGKARDLKTNDRETADSTTKECSDRVLEDAEETVREDYRNWHRAPAPHANEGQGDEKDATRATGERLGRTDRRRGETPRAAGPAADRRRD